MNALKAIVLILAFLATASSIDAAEKEARDWHYGETDEFRETNIGESRITHSILFAPRFFSVSHIQGRDDTFNRRFVFGMDFLTFRYENFLEHRLSSDSSFLLRTTASVGWGYLNVSNHELFRLENLGTNVERESDLDIQNFVFDLGFHAGLKGETWEPFVDYRAVLGIRIQKVKTSEVLYTDPSNGFIDRVADNDRKEEDRAIMHAWGLGMAVHFGEEPWNYSFGMVVRPFNPVEFKDNSTTVWGGGFEFRADNLRLTDDSALALIFRWDFWFSNSEVNDVHHFEIGIGVRFS